MDKEVTPLPMAASSREAGKRTYSREKAPTPAIINLYTKAK